jgi:hypothetical protein
MSTLDKLRTLCRNQPMVLSDAFAQSVSVNQLAIISSSLGLVF